VDAPKLVPVDQVMQHKRLHESGVTDGPLRDPRQCDPRVRTAPLLFSQTTSLFRM